jgi:hypothetical protein
MNYDIWGDVNTNDTGQRKLNVTHRTQESYSDKPQKKNGEGASVVDQNANDCSSCSMSKYILDENSKLVVPTS